ncbi:J domain-containing protein [Nesterenkonia ebinurensis]|uniref:J domain-containing protein n=1 Tax=Nesterenkonia ebinurensis TaxID=2608252 RepID=UPI00168B8AC0|nr:DnaJ domain-containing protein [Nesterenkonia ebinurensis]
MSEPDFYAVLGVTPEAEPQAIRAAYRRAARQHHPDRGGSVEKFHQIQAAWEVLGSAETRADYDLRRRPGTGAEADSPATTEEGAGFTYSRSAPTGNRRTRTKQRAAERSPSADKPVTYEPPLSSPEPLNLTLTSQKVHGGFPAKGLFGGRSQRRQQRSVELLEKHVLSALPAARLFNSVSLAPSETSGRRHRRAKNPTTADHVLLCGPVLVLISSLEVPGATASWDGKSLRTSGRSLPLPDLAAAAKQLRTSLARQIQAEHGAGGQTQTDFQHILLAADGDLFHPVVEPQGAGRSGPTPLAAGRAIGHLVNVLAASDRANLVDRHLMAALRSRLTSPEES